MASVPDVKDEVASAAVETATCVSEEEKETIQQLSLKLLQQTEVNTTLQQKILELNKVVNQHKQLLIQARKEKHEADVEVTKLSQDIENLSTALLEEANLKVREANVEAYNTTVINDKLSNTIKEKDTTIDILQSELSNLKSIISNMDSVQSPHDESKNLNTKENTDYMDSPNLNSSSYGFEEEIPTASYLNSKLLSPFNMKQIYSPLFNQLRFDSPAFILFSECLFGKNSQPSSSTSLNELTYTTTRSTSSLNSFDIRTTKFFLKLLDELDADLRLDKAPCLQSFKLRWNRKSFLIDLMDKIVTIEPLSAATEAWKSQTLQKYIPLSTPTTPTLPNFDENNKNFQLSRTPTNNSTITTYDPSLFKRANAAGHSDTIAPLAVVAACGLCGEKRRDLNFSRLYHIRITSTDPNKIDSSKADYPLCINCANRYRAVVELMKFIGNLNPSGLLANDNLDDYIKSSWAKYVELKTKVWFVVNIGIWSKKEKYGLVYGWQNDWLAHGGTSADESKADFVKNEHATSTSADQENENENQLETTDSRASGSTVVDKPREEIQNAAGENSIEQKIVSKKPSIPSLNNIPGIITASKSDHDITTLGLGKRISSINVGTHHSEDSVNSKPAEIGDREEDQEDEDNQDNQDKESEVFVTPEASETASLDNKSNSKNGLDSSSSEESHPMSATNSDEIE